MDKNQGALFYSIENDPYNFIMKVFCTRWKPYIIQGIKRDGRTRFNRFCKQLPITEKVLTANLKELEADGIIKRIVYYEVPPRVEYELTELGESICPILDMLYEWGWHEMKKRNLQVDPLGEMWHGFREEDKELMKSPYKK